MTWMHGDGAGNGCSDNNGASASQRAGPRQLASVARELHLLEGAIRHAWTESFFQDGMGDCLSKSYKSFTGLHPELSGSGASD